MTETALKSTFATWDDAEILGKFSSIYEENFPKISASSYVEKVVFRAILASTSNF